MIGVVIAVRDGAVFLGEALDSLLLQTPPSTVILVDDGSTDGSGDLARVRGITTITTPPRGVHHARNTGVAALDTPLVAFLDADDRYTPEHHSALLAALGDGDAAIGRARQFVHDDGSGRRYRIPSTPQPGATVATTLIRRAALDRVGPFTDTGAATSMAILATCDVRRTDAVVLERRVHGENMSLRTPELGHADYLATARAAILRRRAGGGGA